MIDPALAVALSVQAHKGIYTIFLGSGVSRSAGIPTGWEIVEDLTRRLAKADGQDPGTDWEVWYRNKFKKEPNYSDLLQIVAPKEAERTSLLKGYFEPSLAEKEKGLKVPTPAHKAIAKLVASGHIRVIVTTNFDRLLEHALEVEKINPYVVSTPAQIAGMMPLTHVDCLVVKIHGDYLDTRIRNTPDELKLYDDESNKLLDQIFSEYGLIVCGWSAEWDFALVDAITRNTRFRFSTYWMARGKLSSKANDVAKHRQAVIVPIETADQGFTELEARVQAISDQQVQDPISVKIAVATMKRYLSEDRYRIQLEDAVIRELNRVKKLVGREVLPFDSPVPDEATYPDRVQKMEAATAALAAMIATGVYWGEKHHEKLWKRCIETLTRTKSVGGTSYNAWEQLYHYPATLVAYSACLAALLRNRFDLIKAIILDNLTTEAHNSQSVPVLEMLGSSRAFHFDGAQWLHKPSANGGKYKTPGSDWMLKQLPVFLQDIFGDDVEFEYLFDDLEFFLALVASDCDLSYHGGRFTWQIGQRRERLQKSLDDALKTDTDHIWFKAGFFGGKADRLEAAAKQVRDDMSRRTW